MRAAERKRETERSELLPAGYDIMRPPGEKLGDIAAFISNCAAKSFRLEALEELNRSLEIDSFGRCLHSADAAPGARKAGTLRAYKFSLAFENSQVGSMELSTGAFCSTLTGHLK
jgi:hypothetical protein